MLRASDATQVHGNAARLLVDGPMTFDAWLAAAARAERYIHLENYIVRDDRTGRSFRDALAEIARSGVAVRVLYDWLGCWATPVRFWRPLREAGAEVRAFAPPSFRDPFSFVRRDHRKVLVVDGEYASVAGMCIGDEWAGNSAAGVPPWRDTAVEFRGPVAAVIDRAFATTWAAAGTPLPLSEASPPDWIPAAGDVAVRVVEGEPGRSRIYRLAQFVAVGVERRLWITDPYFVLPPAMTEALAAAARGGVDVRVIVPAYNNWPVVGGMSRAGYRPLLEAGVRLFEWEGPMIHAKTAVADGIWSRVGSSNMNLASLLGNWELDVAILDRGFATEMERLFERDLGRSAEVTLNRIMHPTGGYDRERRSMERRGRPRDLHPDLAEARRAQRRAYRGSGFGRWLSRISRVSSVLGRALLGRRIIGREDAGWITLIGALLIGMAVIGLLVPRVLAWPLAFFLFWIGVASLFRAGERRTRGGGV
jgi:cardiolipin synthase